MRINGPALKAIRERSGLSQSDLARSTGISQGRISEIESASPAIRPATATTIADHLQVPLLAITQQDEAVAS